MKQVNFNNLKTSSLGFGCANLAAELRLKQAKDVLDTAYDQGITHYDVARSYGYGRCEYILGKFLKGRRDKVTVATKFGNSMREPIVSHHIINMARRAIKLLPDLKAEVRSTVSARPQGSNRFSVTVAAKSLGASLKQMNTDYIDILLLHECSLQAANDPELIAFLESAVRDGKIRHYGLATTFANLPADSATISTKHSIIQTESSPLEKYIKNSSPVHPRLFISHSIFKELRELQMRLANSAANQPQIEANALILRDALKSGKQGLAKLMLLNARRRNPEGIVIFSSTDKNNIKANVQVWTSSEQRAAEVHALETILQGPNNIA